MLRHVATHVVRQGTAPRRNLVSTTSATLKKRPLNVGQIKGDKPAEDAVAATAAAAAPKAAAATGAPPAASKPAGSATSASAKDGASSPPPPASSAGGGGGIVGLVTVAAAGVGAAYYFDVVDFGSAKGSLIKEEKKLEIFKETKMEIDAAKSGKALEQEEKPVAAAAAAAPWEIYKAKKDEIDAAKSEKAAAEDKPQPKPPAVDTAEEKKDKEKKLKKKADADVAPPPAGNRVTTISFPPIDKENRPVQTVVTPEHSPNANRVTGIPFAAANAAIAKDEGSDSTASKPLASAEEAARELASSIEGETEYKLRAAHKALRADLDEAYLSGLDKLTRQELHNRVVQLAAEMEERTKWEAVRLKEFLSMKEKETADKYLEVLQKQRVDFEDLLARKLREQEDSLIRQSNSALQAKDQTIQSVINAASEAQKQESDAELNSATERIERETKAKFEADFGTKLASEKAKFAQELEAKVSAMEEMADRLKKMELALDVSRTFESGSRDAHRVSAAGLAFATVAETSKGAIEELASLKAAAGDESVLGSAISKIPLSIKAGISTLSELQVSFEKVHPVGREAALIPEGRNGLGGQLLGMAFARLTIPPSPDVATENTEDSSAEFVLSRAMGFVRLGELESAVGELDKLQGQAAFAMRDWKQAAMDRITLDKAVKIIKMECALMNHNMGGK